MSGGEFGLERHGRRDQSRSALRRRLFRRPHARGGGRARDGAFRPDLVDAVSVGSLYALTALGIGLIFGVMRLINFAHGELITFAAYALLALFGQPVPVMLFGGHRGGGGAGADHRARRFPPAAQRRSDDAVDLVVRGELLPAEAADPGGGLAAEGARLPARRSAGRSRSSASACSSCRSSTILVSVVLLAGADLVPAVDAARPADARRRRGLSAWRGCWACGRTA